MELLIGIVLGLGLAGIGFAGWGAAKRSRSASSLPKHNLRTPPRKPVALSSPSLTPFQALSQRPEAKVALQNQLIAKVGGDRSKAEELVAKARFGKPGRSENYYWWLAIRQLEDRQQEQAQEQKQAQNL